MSNLFFVYTPFQFYVAQELIRQEHLTNNILLKGYVGNSTQFLEIFDYLKVDGYWQKEYLMPNIGPWLCVDLYHPLSSMCRIRRDYKHIRSLIKENNIDTLYFGDLNNFSARLASRIFPRQGLKICFYEEGASHYDLSLVGGQLGHRSFMAQLYKTFFDTFLYLPTFHQRLGYYTFVKATPFSNLKVDARYSIIPQYHEPYDKLLKVSGVLGEKAKQYIQQECASINIDNSILFLDQPIYEIVQGSIPCYIQTIRKYFSTLSKDTSVVIKYHPRETDDIKQQIEQTFMELGLNYTVISKAINLPVEFYLQQIHFKEVVNFFTSTAFYSGYLFQKLPFHYLIMDFYNKCQDQVPENAHYLEGLVKLYKEQADVK